MGQAFTCDREGCGKVRDRTAEFRGVYDVPKDETDTLWREVAFRLWRDGTTGKVFDSGSLMFHSIECQLAYEIQMENEAVRQAAPHPFTRDHPRSTFCEICGLDEDSEEQGSHVDENGHPWTEDIHAPAPVVRQIVEVHPPPE